MNKLVREQVYNAYTASFVESLISYLESLNDKDTINNMAKLAAMTFTHLEEKELAEMLNELNAIMVADIKTLLIEYVEKTLCENK